MGLRLTDEQYADLKRRMESGKAPKPSIVEKPTKPKRAPNKTEAEYGQILEARKRDGEIVDYGFERIKIRLGDGCWYWPDYDVVNADGTVEIHEVKGFMRDDARVKLQTAARMYPHYKVWIIRKRRFKDGGGFERERVWP